jgi:acetoin utilization deacetylase AcuC-like enzyme
MRVTERGFAARAAGLRRLAEECCGGRLVLVLEGGYDLAGLAGSSRACLEVLRGRDEEFPPGASRSLPALAASKAALRTAWRLP